MNEREFDQINNEGGEGYNPHRARRGREEVESRQAEARDRALTPEGKIDALYRRIEIECGSVAREWGDNDAIDALMRDLHAQVKTLQAEIDGPFLAVWTLETTAARRASWNARAKAGEFNEASAKGKPRVDMAKLVAAEKEQGWTMTQLRRAVEVYKRRGEIA